MVTPNASRRDRFGSIRAMGRSRSSIFEKKRASRFGIFARSGVLSSTAMLASKTNTAPAERTGDPGDPERAFSRILERLLALPANEVERPNANLLKAARICLAACARVAPLRGELDRLYDFSLEDIDALAEIAHAAIHVDTLGDDASNARIHRLVTEGRQLRRALIGAARPLADWGYLRSDHVDHLASGRSHVEQVGDLAGLGTLFRSQWACIADMTPATEREVARAERLSTELMRALVERDTARTDPERNATRLRARVFTLLKRAYNRLLRAVQYVRFDYGDAAVFVPPLSPGRSKTKRTDKKARRSVPAGGDLGVDLLVTVEATEVGVEVGADGARDRAPAGGDGERGEVLGVGLEVEEDVVLPLGRRRVAEPEDHPVVAGDGGVPPGVDLRLGKSAAVVSADGHRSDLEGGLPEVLQEEIERRRSGPD